MKISSVGPDLGSLPFMVKGRPDIWGIRGLRGGWWIHKNVEE